MGCVPPNREDKEKPPPPSIMANTTIRIAGSDFFSPMGREEREDVRSKALPPPDVTFFSRLLGLLFIISSSFQFYLYYIIEKYSFPRILFSKNTFML